MKDTFIVALQVDSFMFVSSNCPCELVAGTICHFMFRVKALYTFSMRVWRARKLRAQFVPLSAWEQF